jgi:hypothetical protein
MALWIDCQDLTASDLIPYDGQLSSVVSAEGIDVEGKSQIAHERITSILAMLFPLKTQMSSTDAAASIVVTAPLRRWHALLTLEGVYREAYFRHLSERHKARADYLVSCADEAMNSMLSVGLGISERPIRRAPPLELTPGTGAMAAGIWHFASTLVASDREGEGSEVASTILTSDSGVSVKLACPPAGEMKMHIYAGSSPERLYRQTIEPVPVAASYLVEEIDLTRPLLEWGQTPDRYLHIDRRLRRG